MSGVNDTSQVEIKVIEQTQSAPLSDLEAKFYIEQTLMRIGIHPNLADVVLRISKKILKSKNTQTEYSIKALTKYTGVVFIGDQAESDSAPGVNIINPVLFMKSPGDTETRICSTKLNIRAVAFTGPRPRGWPILYPDVYALGKYSYEETYYGRNYDLTYFNRDILNIADLSSHPWNDTLFVKNLQILFTGKVSLAGKRVVVDLSGMDLAKALYILRVYLKLMTEYQPGAVTFPESISSSKLIKNFVNGERQVTPEFKIPEAFVIGEMLEWLEKNKKQLGIPGDMKPTPGNYYYWSVVPISLLRLLYVTTNCDDKSIQPIYEMLLTAEYNKITDIVKTHADDVENYQKYREVVMQELIYRDIYINKFGLAKFNEIVKNRFAKYGNSGVKFPGLQGLILEIISETEANVVRGLYESYVKSLNQSTPEIQTWSKLVRLINSRVYERSTRIIPELITEIKQYIPENYNFRNPGADWIRDMISGAPIICPHALFLLFSRDPNLKTDSEEKMSAVKIIEEMMKMYAEIIDNQYYCKICGEYFGSVLIEEKLYDIKDNSLFREDNSELIQEIYKYSSTILTSGVTYTNIVLRLNLGKLLRRILKVSLPIVEELINKIRKIKTFSKQDIDARRIIYIVSCAYASIAIMIKSSEGGIQFNGLPGVSNTNDAVAKYIVSKIMHDYGSYLNYMQDITPGILETSIIGIMNKVAMKIDDAIPPGEQLLMEITPQDSYRLLAILNRLAASINAGQGVLEYVPDVSVLNVSQITSILDSVYKKVTNPGGKYFMTTIARSLLDISKMNPGKFEFSPPEWYKPDIAFNEFILMFASRDAKRNIFTDELSGKLRRPRDIITPRDINLVYGNSHGLHKHIWSKYKYTNTGVLTKKDIKPGIDISQFEDVICEVCGYEMRNIISGKSVDTGVSEDIERSFLKSSFFNYYTYKCPETGTLHSPGKDGICIKCGYGGDPGAFEKKYFAKFKSRGSQKFGEPQPRDIKFSLKFTGNTVILDMMKNYKPELYLISNFIGKIFPFYEKGSTLRNSMIKTYGLSKTELQFLFTNIGYCEGKTWNDCIKSLVIKQTTDSVSVASDAHEILYLQRLTKIGTLIIKIKTILSQLINNEAIPVLSEAIKGVLSILSDTQRNQLRGINFKFIEKINLYIKLHPRIMDLSQSVLGRSLIDEYNYIASGQAYETLIKSLDSMYDELRGIFGIEFANEFMLYTIMCVIEHEKIGMKLEESKSILIPGANALGTVNESAFGLDDPGTDAYSGDNIDTLYNPDYISYHNFDYNFNKESIDRGSQYYED